MKTNITRRILTAFAVSAFFVGGVMAQTHQSPVLKSDEYADESPAVVQITAGKTLPVYVTPDTYYHPNWDANNSTAGADAELTDGFTWTFSASNGNVTLGSQTDNYVVVTAAGAAASTSTVSVYETAPAAYGGCDNSGSPSTLDFEVVAIPTVTAPATSYFKFCDGSAAADGPATISPTINGTSSFNVIWDVMVYNTTVTDTTTATEWYDNSYTALGVAGYHTENVAATPDAIAASGAYDLMANASAAIANADFIVRNNERTVYEFVVRDLNDLVSRKSDFLALTGTATGSITDDQYVYYDVAGGAAGTTNHTVQVVVLPAPSTGPIYHIPALWAN